MGAVPASFSSAIDEALGRTRRLLFEDFDPGRYLTIGLVAFLALLADGCTPSVGGGVAGLGMGMGLFGAAPFSIALGSPGGAIVWVPLLALGAMLLVVMLWLAARGQLIFVESVVFERAHLRDPWARLAPRARPLFLWTLGFAALAGLALAASWAPSVWLLRAADGEAGVLSAAAVAIGMAAAFVLTLALAATWVVMHHFVVPLYYRDHGTLGRAWRAVLALMRAHPLDFVLYGLGLIVLHVAVQAIVGALVVATCCTIKPLVALPYVSTLFYLPLLVFVRSFSIAFLGRYGEAYRIGAQATES